MINLTHSYFVYSSLVHSFRLVLLPFLLLFYSAGSLADSNSFSCSQVTDVPQIECEALVAFYQQADGEAWQDHTGWLNDTTISNWYGVTVIEGQVTELKLGNNHLLGTLSPQLCQLSQLQILLLGHDRPDATNQLSGEIPACLGQLSQLKVFSLASNHFTGTLPPELGQLTQLTHFMLNDNQLSGVIPETFCQLSNLQYLDLSANEQLQGSLPPCLGQLTQLTVLWLYHNQLQGTIPPELCQLTQLKYLGLGRNQLSGEIPNCLGNFTSLQILYLSMNRLTGLLPTTFASLVNLHQLYIDNNQLVGPLPEAFVNLVLTSPQLIQLHLQRNLFGLTECQAVQKWTDRGGWVENLPGWFDGGLVHSPQNGGIYFEQHCPPASPLLTIAKIGDGHGTVTGEGIECGNACTKNYPLHTQVMLTATPMASFEFAGWSDGCEGTQTTTTVTMDKHKTCTARFNVPSSFSCQTVTDVSPAECEALVAFYKATGGDNWTRNEGWLMDTQVARWYAVTVQNRQVIELKPDENNLVGVIPPETCELKSLQTLHLGHYHYLYGNQLSGTIPACLGHLNQLKYLSLASNDLSGPIPPELGNLTQLEYFNLFDNPEFKSTLPEELCNLTALQELHFGLEKLSGPIPECIGNLHNLRVLASTWTGEISGKIPDSLCQLTHLERLSLRHNRLTGEVPACIGELKNLIGVDINENNLTGNIPNEICNLTELSTLSLGVNQLTGVIPACLGETLTKLQFLHLNNNQFSGWEPNSFSKLPNLRQFFLSNNQLTSPLPEEFVNMAFANKNLLQLDLNGNNLDSNDCRSIQILRSRGGWVEYLPQWGGDGFSHSPQKSGFDFEIDCASFALQVLAVSKIGEGHGTITGDGIHCGTDCVDAYGVNTRLTLTAIPDTDSVFSGWGGDCQGTDTNTSLTLNADKTCTAQFQLRPSVLTLTVKGQGQISGPHLSCTQSGGECTAEYSAHETVTLTATGLGTWNFKAWQGDCVGTTNPLPVLMNQSKHCTAIFEPGLWVGLVDFSATVLAKGTVLQWQTAGEIDTVGFQLWQAQAKEGDCQDYVNYTEVTRLTDSLMESQGTLIEGASYSYDIPTIFPGSCYGLEAVEVQGNSTFYLIGPGIHGWLEVSM